MPKRKSDRTLVATGEILTLLGAFVALIVGVIEIVGGFPFSLALAVGIAYFALGLLSVLFTLQIRRRYDTTKTILLLVFAILFLILWTQGGLGIYAAVTGILMLIGVIILIIGKG